MEYHCFSNGTCSHQNLSSNSQYQKATKKIQGEIIAFLPFLIVYDNNHT